MVLCPNTRVLQAKESLRLAGHYHVCATVDHFESPRSRRDTHVRLHAKNWTYGELRFWLCSKFNRMQIMQVHTKKCAHIVLLLHHGDLFFSIVQVLEVMSNKTPRTGDGALDPQVQPIVVGCLRDPEARPCRTKGHDYKETTMWKVLATTDESSTSFTVLLKFVNCILTACQHYADILCKKTHQLNDLASPGALLIHFGFQ